MVLANTPNRAKQLVITQIFETISYSDFLKLRTSLASFFNIYDSECSQLIDIYSIDSEDELRKIKSTLIKMKNIKNILL